MNSQPNEFLNYQTDARFLFARGFSSDWIRDEDYFLFLWNSSENPVRIQMDDREVMLPPGSVSCSTYLQSLEVLEKAPDSLVTILFNREFYCVHTHDSEVSCTGLLFFGSDVSPVLMLDRPEKERFATLVDVLEEEFSISDTNQEEMLRILLKRFIIRCTRLAKSQLLKRSDRQSDIDVIRTFNVLVEEHFRTKKRVSDYAELMHKSPKTVTNLFSRYSRNTPLQVIHNRVIMEAKRLLVYTDKAVKEVGYDLGYSDPAQFSKLFKNHTGKTTTEFKATSKKLPIKKN
ncbi:MAG: AraC family transcriptional regulator [Balneolaceae bacterium]